MGRMIRALVLLAAAVVAVPSAGRAEPAASILFAARSLPAPGPAAPFGGYARGCLAGARPLPESGPTWQAMRLSRNR